MTDEQKYEIRLAVAESKIDGHTLMIENGQELTARIVDRMDQQAARMDAHILEQSRRDTEMTTVINDCRLAITEWKATADTFISTAKNFMRVGVAILSGFAVVVSAIWGVYVFRIEHPQAVQVEVKK